MNTKEIRAEARRLFDESLDLEEELTSGVVDDAEARRLTAYHTGWREALLKLFPDLDVDDPRDFPIP
jgi:hypothetical protein